MKFAVAPLSVLLLGTLQAAALPVGSAVQQWRPAELAFTAETEIAEPFDYEHAHFSAVFTGPDGARLDLPGFWDGGHSWKIRFTPTRAGEWSFVTRFSNPDDRGLHGQSGRLCAGAPDTSPAIRRHGGFLRVSADRRFLTYSDGTPFFWLGDTWWAAPSVNVPFDVFRRQVDARVAQGFTVFQAHGYGPLFADSKTDAFSAVRNADAESLRYWRETDRLIAYADEKGLVGMMGFARGDMLDRFSLVELQRLWHYYLARYGAYAMSSLITQEYNIEPDKRQQHLPNLFALGQFIKDCDPYTRAMTAHPWVRSRDLRQAWGEPWLDFIMLQAGHRRFEAAKAYHEIWRQPTPKPFLESEANYEGFVSTNFTVNAAAIRRSAYTAIQAGSFGFTYGAQGLYAGVLVRDRPGPTAKWGPVLTWEEGLALAGGAQLQHLRACYDSVAWWKLCPLPDALVPATDEVLVKAEPPDTFLLYYVSSKKPAKDLRLKAVPEGACYAAVWFDPRTGKKSTVEELVSAGDGLRLPLRPDTQDWMLILRRRPL